MTETGPRKGLWELMGQKRSTDESPPSPPATEDPATSTPPTDETSAAPSPAPLDLEESLPDTKPRGRGLWQLMQQAETAPAAQDTESPATALPDAVVPDAMRSAFEAPVKGADRRLRQLEAPEVEIVDDEGDVPLEALDESEEAAPGPERLPAELVSALPGTPQSLAPPEPRLGLSRSALWSVILGGISVPLSLIAIYPAIWSRIPPSVTGFAALMLGFLAQGDVQRTQRPRQGLVLSYVGMGLGVFAMFAGPAIYAPLDVYGQWCNSYTGVNLQQIGLATSAYTQQYQTFPAGGLFREIPQGEPEPQHGWMTLLLPHLPEGAEVARQIDLSKPYFDPANQAAMSRRIPTFMAAGGSSELIQGKYGPAHFAGLGGVVRLADGSMAHVGIFDTNSDTTRDDILDGTSNTMLAGEIATKYPAWGEAKNWRQIGKGLNRDADGFGNARHSGAMFLMADGSVRYFANKTDPKVLQALSTRDGEETP